MKIIFLDIDGVLINRAAMKAGFGKVDPECVRRLNSLLERSGAWIVVSSSWRQGETRITLCDQLNAWGVTPGHVLDRTGAVRDKRGNEIQEWLDERAKHRDDVEAFVIIDDERDMLHLLPFLVKTNIVDGLTDEHVEQALAVLNNFDTITPLERTTEHAAEQEGTR